MKKLLKSIALGLMMFLAVQVQAENNPKNGNLPNVEPVTNYVSAQPQDVQQVPCYVVYYICDTPYWAYAGELTSNGCDFQQNVAISVSDWYNKAFGCE